MNNKLGFTLPSIYGRSSKFSTDIAKTYGYPVVHLNADYPENAYKVA
jgi:2-oxoglutarate dehydrogenase complex dehydrogenase (E1) component-like enzyme